MSHHTLIAFVPDQPRLLDEAASRFMRSGLRIESMSVTRAGQPGFSRLTLVVHPDDVGRVTRQLEHFMVTPAGGVSAIPQPAKASTAFAELSPYTWQADGAAEDEAA